VSLESVKSANETFIQRCMSLCTGQVQSSKIERRTYGFVIGEDAFAKAMDEHVQTANFSVGKMDPLVNEGRFFEGTAKKARVGCKASN